MTEFEKAKEILKKASRSGSRLGLERILELVSIFDNPQDKLKTIHVAGTNGKGSFCAMISAALSACGYKTGTFSSPVMLEVNDCIRINGLPVDESVFAKAVFKIDAASKQMTDKPTEFEMLTAVAFYIFWQEKCDFAVVECGMGGDTDSTNVISKPLISVITNVTIDHKDYLGNTVSEIASHKAGIIKSGVPVYFGGNDDEAYKVVLQAAKANCSVLYRPDYESVSFPDNGDLNGDDVHINYKGIDYCTPLRGSYQVCNLLNVLSCIDILAEQGISLSPELVRKGIASVHWEGRFEKLCDDPLVIFDGAHNYDGMKELCNSIKRYFNGIKPVILIGVLADKDYRSYADMLRPLVNCAFAVAPDSPRALSSEKLAECFNGFGLDTKAFPDIAAGFDEAYSYCKLKQLPLFVIGSLYMYKDIKNALKKINSK